MLMVSVRSAVGEVGLRASLFARGHWPPQSEEPVGEPEAQALDEAP